MNHVSEHDIYHVQDWIQNALFPRELIEVKSRPIPRPFPWLRGAGSVEQPTP